MRTLHDIPTLHNVPVLVRTAMNVPLQDGHVIDDYRLRRSAPTIRFLAERGARVILISHIGRDAAATLAPVAEALGKIVPHVSFFGETIGPGARAKVRELLPGNVLVLENLRRHKGEKENDAAFAQELAALGDVFVQDSFDTCHREHASIVGVPKLLPSYAGLTLEEEVRELSAARSPEHPALAVIGGAKFSTKEPVLTALLAAYDHVFVGGALANDFLKASGKSVGASLVSDADPEAVHRLLNNDHLVLPQDTRVARKDQVDDPEVRTLSHVVTIDSIADDEIALDHGPATVARLAQLANRSKTVLWNGPLGNYERGFTDATEDFARALAQSKTHSVIGGGDTVAAIEKLGLLPHFSFVSTGGGAMLDLLTHGTLPGIQALG